MTVKARKRRLRGQAPRGRSWIYLAAVGIAAAAVIFSGILLLARGSDGGSGVQVVVPTPGLPGLVRQGRFLGQADAPVRIVEYADFQ